MDEVLFADPRLTPKFIRNLKQALGPKRQNVQRLREVAREALKDYVDKDNSVRRQLFNDARHELLLAKLELHKAINSELKHLSGQGHGVTNRDINALWSLMLEEDGVDARR